VSVTIPGVPASVPRARVLDLIESLGFDPRELVSLRFEPGGIYAEVFADQRPGRTGFTERWRFTTDGQAAATHRICIPITEDKEPPTS